jgi:hypothetical protein
MLVFYLALIVVFLGILFFVYSIKTESPLNNDFSQFGNKDLDLYEINGNYSDNLNDPNDGLESPANVYQDGSVDDEDAKQPEFQPLIGGSGYQATIYEDTKLSVRFGREAAPGDLYSGLKRIGSGEFSVSGNSFDMKIESKYFRFDFSHIKKIDGYDNSILLFVDYIKYPYLIISDNFSFADEVIKKYNGV